MSPADAGTLGHEGDVVMGGERHGTKEFPNPVLVLVTAAAGPGGLTVALELGDDSVRVPTPDVNIRRVGGDGPAIYVISGIMAAGKSSVAQALAERLPRSVHVRGDVFPSVHRQRARRDDARRRARRRARATPAPSRARRAGRPAVHSGRLRGRPPGHHRRRRAAGDGRPHHGPPVARRRAGARCGRGRSTARPAATSTATAR